MKDENTSTRNPTLDQFPSRPIQADPIALFQSDLSPFCLGNDDLDTKIKD